MSSDLIIPYPPAKLARAAWARMIGLLLLGLLGAVALAYYGYQLHRLNAAVNTYQLAVFQYQMRTEAIDRLSDMEAAFNRYLLDGTPRTPDFLKPISKGSSSWRRRIPTPRTISFYKAF
jgi:hypothetical protein